ncbi:hypothetical protein D3Y55_10145 [Mesorhizobium sp. DCY119]|nr:hypothetical protein D3Y55_10145 [Mesorhizobium sp. DCY119]
MKTSCKEKLRSQQLGQRKPACKPKAESAGPCAHRQRHHGLFFEIATKTMLAAMRQRLSAPVATTAKIIIGTVAFAALAGVAFAAWMENGAAIFMATVEAGLAWCF